MTFTQQKHTPHLIFQRLNTHIFKCGQLPCSLFIRQHKGKPNRGFHLTSGLMDLQNVNDNIKHPEKPSWTLPT